LAINVARLEPEPIWSKGRRNEDTIHLAAGLYRHDCSSCIRVLNSHVTWPIMDVEATIAARQAEVAAQRRMLD